MDARPSEYIPSSTRHVSAIIFYWECLISLMHLYAQTSDHPGKTFWHRLYKHLDIE